MSARVPSRSALVAMVALFACCHSSRDAGPIDAGTPKESALRARIETALREKGPGYAPRTRHKNPDGTAKFTNRLILESSPYLQQHAHNPVNWYPWGDEAFEEALKTGRPVFLSIGYSTCHWCHVMEEESFEDEEIAQYLNAHYIAIKVDREERPDLDATYIQFVQAMTGGSGWPMTLWLTPAREPFFAATYLPARAGDRGAPQGFIEILHAQIEHFLSDPNVADAAHEFATRLQTALESKFQSGEGPNESVFKTARAQAAQRFDPSAGGARGAPKFPASFPTRLLLRIARRANDADARSMALTTLAHMRSGGIYDQVGGGFHRYSTDAHWLVPHFEKMLYDNAQLAIEYLEGAQTAGSREHQL